MLNLRVSDQFQALVKIGDKSFEETGLLMADASFFNLFDHRFIKGDPATALAAPGAIVITESTAQRLFGSEEPVGQAVEIERYPFDGLHISGVIADPTTTTHCHFNYLISTETLAEGRQRTFVLEQWLNFPVYTYILVEPESDMDLIGDKMAEIFETNAGERARQAGVGFRFILQKLTDIHLRSQLEYEMEPNGNMAYVTVFGIVAAFILLIACINFMNLSTARSGNRAREVGMRKVFGAYRNQLISQFLGESVLTAALSLLLGLFILFLVLPAFEYLTGLSVAFRDVTNVFSLAGLACILLLTGIVAGSYPALVLSSFRPVYMLKGTLSRVSRNELFRRVLVIVQFTVSVALIIGTMTVLNQVRFMKDSDLGFDKERVIVIPFEERDPNLAFKQALLQHPEIVTTAYSSSVPGRMIGAHVYQPEGRSDDETFLMSTTRIDDDFIETFGMQIVEGRDLSEELSTDAGGVCLLSEAAARRFNWEDGAVGKSLINRTVEALSARVVGIVKDYHHRSLREAIEPVVFLGSRQSAAFLSVKVSSGSIGVTIDFLRTTWTSFFPNRDFEYFFLDESFDAQYRAEDKLRDIFLVFALLAILIACLGLFGLSAFTAEQKTKEIGIRKVLGASSGSIIRRLSTSYIKWVVVANIIAWPLSYFLMTRWLENFAYRVNIGIWVFVTGGVLALGIAVLTISYQSIKASSANPVDALRYE